MPGVVTDLMTAVTKLSKSVAHLSKVNNDLAQQMEHTQRKFESMATANSQLSAKVAELSQKLASRNWQDFKHPAQHVKKTCVLGSSIIRDIDPEKLENTDVISVSGGKIPTIHKKLNDLSCDYGRIVIMVGGNDCDSVNAESSERPVSDLLEDYRRLVNDARKCSTDVCIGTVCPRLKGQHVTERIDALNAGLRVLSDEEQCSIVNNDECFKLSNGCANDGYILDGVHLNYAGTNRLVKDLSLPIKKGHEGNVCRRKRPTKPHPAHPSAAHPSRPDNTYQAHSSLRRNEKPATNQSRPTLSSHKYHDEQQWSESWHGDETWQNFDRDQGDWHVPSYHRRRSPKPNAHPSNYHTNQYQGNEQRRGCDFCSEPNHSKHRCRHGQPITCQTCGEKGHKSKHHYQH